MLLYPLATFLTENVKLTQSASVVPESRPQSGCSVHQTLAPQSAPVLMRKTSMYMYIHPEFKHLYICTKYELTVFSICVMYIIFWLFHLKVTVNVHKIKFNKISSYLFSWFSLAWPWHVLEMLLLLLSWKLLWLNDPGRFYIFNARWALFRERVLRKCWCYSNEKKDIVICCNPRKLF